MKIKNKYNLEKPTNEEEQSRKKRLEKEDLIEDYKFVRNEKGQLEIKKTGSHSLQEIINSHKDEAGLENILKKYHLTKNTKISTIAMLPEVNKKQAIYGDDTLIQKDNINKQEIEKIIKANNKKIEELKKQMQELTKNNETKKEEIKETTNE